jgi:V8-like Glu-specific endopeptidase
MSRGRKTAASFCALLVLGLASQASAALASPTEVVPDPTLPGIAVNGVVFISEGPGGGFGRCSGTSLNSPSMSIVVTAGHCVYEEGHFYDHKWVFVPGYRYGERPFGTFTAKWLGTTPQWRDSENFNFDVGMAVVGRNEKGQRLGEAVGGDEIAWGLSPRQVFDVWGYPVARPFTGATLEHCPATPFIGHSFGSVLHRGPLDLAVQCNVSPGSSGGGWTIHGNVVNSVTSNGFDDDPATDYGPYFGREVGRLFHRAERIR